MSLFSVECGSDATVLKFPAKLDAVACQELLDLLKEWVAAPPQRYVLDFSALVGLEAVAFRALTLFHRALKNVGSAIHSVGYSAELQAQLIDGGLGEVLSLKSPGGNVDMAFVGAFIEAVKNTLRIQANTEVEIGDYHLQGPGEEFSADIAGVISLASRNYNGSLALCFPAPVFLQIYSNMLTERHEVITREMEDAAGELLNMIFGVAKAELNDKVNAEIQRAIPAIIRGERLRVHHLGRASVIVVPCRTEIGEFHLEMSMEPA